MSAPTATETPIWFGSTERPLFGWLSTPAGGASRGGVLLAPPVGREARAARRAFRHLGTQLAERGYVALRFDYDGTGDSSGAFADPDRGVAWTGSVQHAVSYLRSLGVPEVSAIGMRLGATIVGAAAEAFDLGLSAAVLWDPCETGRGYLRELSALETLRRENVPVELDGAIETAEFVFTQEAASQVRPMSLQKKGSRLLATRVLVMSRAERPISDRFRDRFEGDKVEWQTTTEQSGMLDVEPLAAVLPLATMRDVSGWLAADASPLTPFDVPESPAVVTMHPTPDGATVTERFVRLGQGELFGIVTEPVGDAHGPWVVMFNVANEEHTGPSRLWVELARRWAQHGLRSVRFDLTGLGDSPQIPGRSGRLMYDVAWLDDAADVARLMTPDDPSNTVFVGLCSGAYLATEAALAVRARGACAINPPVGMDFLSGVSKLGRSQRAWVRVVADQLREVALRLRWVTIVLWYVCRVIMPSVFAADLMRATVANGTDLLVISSAEDLSPYPDRPSLGRFFNPRLVSPSNYRVHFVPGLDHSMHTAEGRDRAVAMLDRHILEQFAGETPTRPDHDTEEGA